MTHGRGSLTIEDILRINSFSTFYGKQFDVSDRLGMVAISVRKPLESASVFSVPFLDGNERGVMRCINIRDQTELQFNLDDGVGAFSPRWSLNCEQLAFCITNGEWVRLAVGDPNTGDVRTVSDREIWLRPGMSPVAWLDQQTIICELLEPGTKSVGVVSETASARAVLSDWPDAWKGARATAGLVRTLQGDRGFPVGTLATVDVRSGEVREHLDITTAPAGVAAFGCREREVPFEPERSLEDDAQTGELIADGVYGESRILCRSGENGTFVILNTGGGGDVVVYRADEFLINRGPFSNEIVEFGGNGSAKDRYILIEQRDGNGRKPVVLSIYPGYLVRGDRTRFRNINNISSLNPYLLASMGFAIVRPEVDLSEVPAGGIASQIEVAVSRCVENLVEHRNIDGSNVHVLGHSLGGWAALLMATRTNLFRSVIACSAPTNLISLHGEIDVRSRYGDDFTYMSSLYESVFKLSGPPWRQLDTYVEHSPLFGVDTMNIPALLVHGDLDYVPISQAEEFMSAMEYSGKDARLLRLAGEGHVLANPHNMRAFVACVGDWLSEHHG